MKNKILVAFAVLFAAAAHAQTDTTTTTTAFTTDTFNIGTAYVANPESLKGLTTETLRPEHIFPVLGTYTASDAAANVTVTLDETNKGIVWVEGLPQGRFKALMKKAPSTYKVPAQRTEEGKDVSEGTLFLNPSNNELTIVLGRPFNDADPASVFTADAKTKKKAWQYTGVKTSVEPAIAPSAPQQ